MGLGMNRSMFCCGILWQGQRRSIDNKVNDRVLNVSALECGTPSSIPESVKLQQVTLYLYRRHLHYVPRRKSWQCVPPSPYT